MAFFESGQNYYDFIDKKIKSTLTVRVIYCAAVCMFFSLFYMPAIIQSTTAFFKPREVISSAEQLMRLGNTDDVCSISLEKAEGSVTGEEVGLSDEVISQQVREILTSGQDSSSLDDSGSLFIWFYGRRAVLVPVGGKTVVVFVNSTATENLNNIYATVKSVPTGQQEYFTSLFSGRTRGEVINTVYMQQVDPTLPVIPLVSCLGAIGLSVFFFLKNVRVLMNPQLHPVNIFFEDYPNLSKEDASFELSSGECVCLAKGLYTHNGWLMYRTSSTVNVCHMDCCRWVDYHFVGESVFFQKLTQKYKVKMLLGNKKFFKFNFNGKPYELDDFVKQIMQRVPWLIVGTNDENMKKISGKPDKILEYSEEKRSGMLAGSSARDSYLSDEDTERTQI